MREGAKMRQSHGATYQKAIADLARSLEADSDMTYERAHEWAKAAFETIEGFTRVAQGVRPEQLPNRPRVESLKWPGRTADLNLE